MENKHMIGQDNLKIPCEFTGEFTGNSLEFTGNSLENHWAITENSLNIH